MSISKFQNVIKGGCGQVVIFGMAAVFIGGLAYQGCGASLSNQNVAPGEVEVAQVSGVPISSKTIQTAVEAQMQQFGGASDALPPSFEILLLGQALTRAIDEANATALAKQNGVDASDAAILKFVDAELGKLPQTAREQLTASGALKPGATDAELEAVVKKQTGKTIAELVKSQGEDVRKALADPKQAPQIKSSITQLLVIDTYKKKVNVGDEDVRKSFDTYQVKRVVVPFTGAAPGGLAPATPNNLDENAAREKAEKALAEARGGKSFEDVMNAYSGEPAQGPGKKVSENVLPPLTAEQIAIQPEYAPLRNLKTGEISNVEKSPEGFVIYKLVGVKNELPKDFAIRTDFYRDQILGRRAQKAYQDDLKRYGESNKPRFSSDAYEALYAFTKLSAPVPGASPSTPPPTPNEAQLREVIDRAKRVSKDEPDFRIAAIVRRAAFDRMYEQAKDKNALAEERAETLLASVEAKDDFDTRIELVDSFLGQRKYAQAAEQLEAAARANTLYDAQGQTRFGTISSKLVALKKDGQLPADVEGRIHGEQDRWRREKKNADVQQAEAAKLQAQDAAKQAAAERAAKPKPKIEDVAPKR